MFSFVTMTHSTSCKSNISGAAMFKGIFFSISTFVTTYSTVLILGVEEQPTKNKAITGNNIINFFIVYSPD